MHLPVPGPASFSSDSPSAVSSSIFHKTLAAPPERKSKTSKPDQSRFQRCGDRTLVLISVSVLPSPVRSSWSLQATGSRETPGRSVLLGHLLGPRRPAVPEFSWSAPGILPVCEKQKLSTSTQGGGEDRGGGGEDAPDINAGARQAEDRQTGSWAGRHRWLPLCQKVGFVQLEEGLFLSASLSLPLASSLLSN